MDKLSKVETEIQELDDWIKTNPDSRELKRAIAVKLALQGWTYKAIAKILNVSKSFIGQWKSQFGQRGIEGLKLSYKGAKSHLTEEQKQETFVWLYQRDYWDLSELECYLTEGYQQGNGDSTVDFLKKLLKKNAEKKIMIFWDGASYHKGKLMQEFLAEVNEGLEPKEWKITCHLFAPYSPEQNPIEAVWLSLKNLLRRCYRFCKKFSIMKKIFNLLVEFKLFTFPNLKNYDAFSCLI